MKKLLTILTIATLLSCSTDDANECNCEKETYTFEQGTTINQAGLPVTTFTKVILSNEVVPCQDEQPQQSNGDNTYFVIECN